MKIIVSNIAHDIDERFIQYIIAEVQAQMEEKFDNKKTAALDKYIEENKLFNNMTCKQIFNLAFNHLVYDDFTNYYVIHIDHNALIPKTNMRIIRACEFVNNGNHEVAGYKLLDKIMVNVDELQQEFLASST